MRVNEDRCPTCRQARGERHKETSAPPSVKTMERWMDAGIARATDGCRVEPDGVCPHGHLSWMIVKGII